MSLNYRLAERKSKAEAPTTIGETMAHSIEGFEDPITIPGWYPRTIVRYAGLHPAAVSPQGNRDVRGSRRVLYRIVHQVYYHLHHETRVHVYQAVAIRRLNDERMLRDAPVHVAKCFLDYVIHELEAGIKTHPPIL